MDRPLILTYSHNWSARKFGWECPELSKSKVKLKSINFEDAEHNFRFFPKRFLWRRVPYIKWIGTNDPPTSLSIIISDELTYFESLYITINRNLLIIGLFSIVITLVIGFKAEIIDWFRFKHFSNPRSSNFTQQPGNQVNSTEIIEWYDNDRREWVTKTNADYATYNDGTLMKHATSPSEWDSCNKIGAGCWCYFGEPYDSVSYWGKLYNYYAVMDKEHKGVIPPGWRLFSTDEIFRFAKNHPGRGGYLLKSKTGWHSRPNGKSGAGMDSLSFNAKPYGYCTPQFEFIKAGYETGWWTSSIYQQAYPDYVLYYSWQVQANYDSVFWFERQLHYGFYLRFIKDH